MSKEDKDFEMQDGLHSKLLEIISDQCKMLEDRARSISKSFWLAKYAQNEKSGIFERGHLGCRIRVMGTYGDLIYAEWYKTIWIKPKGASKAKPIAKYIRKAKRDPFGYNIEALKRIAKPIEVEEVLEAEKAFRIIREQNHCLTQLRKYAKKLAEADRQWRNL